MSTIPVPSWAEVREVYEPGTVDEYRRYASDAVEVPGTITHEQAAATTATVRLEHTFHPRSSGQDGPWYRPHVVLGVETDSQREVLLTPDVARRLAAELIAAADRLEASPAR